MKIGFIGPAGGDLNLLRQAIEFLIHDAGVDQAIYLGVDEDIDATVTVLAEEIMEGSASTEAFYDRALALARDGDAAAIDQLLAADERVRRLRCVRKLPPAPARTVEMIEDRIVTVVYDKGTLQEDDIANATLLVYGLAKEPLLKRFGPRYFFTPGPLYNQRVAVVEADSESNITIGLYDPAGAPVWRETLAGRGGSRVTVAS